jgi:hypothetical protein
MSLEIRHSVPATAALLGVLLSSLAQAGPLNLADPTPRQIRIEVDQELHDYGAIGAAYSLPIQASFTSDGTVATIVVPGSATAAFIDEFFAGAVTTVPGSFSDYVITIDVASGDVTSASATGTLNTAVGLVPVAQTASSTTLAGFEIFPFMGFDFPLFCTSGATCTIVPGAPYDPLTGRANAVGIIVTSVFNTFTPFGDIRLTENEHLTCDTSVNAKDFIPTEGVRIGLDVQSNLATARPVEVKMWIKEGDGSFISAINLGATGGVFLNAGEHTTFAQQPLFTVGPATPLGDWTVGCRLLDPVTGETLAEDQDTFQVLTTR